MRVTVEKMIRSRPCALFSLALTITVSMAISSPSLAAPSSGGEKRSLPSGHSLGYEAHLEVLQLREDLLVPMRFTGPQLGLSLDWFYHARNFWFWLNIGAAFAYLQERLENPAMALSTWARLAMVFRVHESSKNEWDLGASWRSRVTAAMLVSWDDAHIYALASHMLGPVARFQWTGLGRTDILIELTLPLLGFVGRTEEIRYSKQEYSNGRYLYAEPHKQLFFASLPNYWSVELTLGARWKLRRSNLRLSYVLDFEREARPRPFARLSHGLVLAQEFSLGGGK